MNIPQDILNRVEDLYSYVKDYVISVIIGGSHTLDYIDNKDDVDIFYVCENTENRKTALFKYYEWTQLKDNKAFKKEHKISTLFYTIDMYNQKMLDRPWIYLFNFQVVLHGEYKPQYDILSKKDDYIQVLKRALNYVIEYKEQENKYHKWIYHILSGIYILENNSYTLTDEQIKNVNICHNLIETDKVAELFEYCVNKLNTF